MKVLVIPDVHLKPNMVEEAAAAYKKLSEQERRQPVELRQSTGIVCLGDLADDWGQQDNLELYKQTYDRVIRLITEVRDQDFYFCIGNHDASYLWMKFESGYSVKAEHLVREKMLELRNAFADAEKFAYVHRIDNVIFSHAGICALFAMKHAKTAETVDQLIYIINHELTEHELWMDESPLWIRMQYSNVWTLKGNLLQVVGHTPVKFPLFDERKNLLSLDTFSTDREGNPIGDCRFVIVDTIEKTFEYAS